MSRITVTGEGAWQTVTVTRGELLEVLVQLGESAALQAANLTARAAESAREAGADPVAGVREQLAAFHEDLDDGGLAWQGLVRVVQELVDSKWFTPTEGA
ncbi:hypothetical protein [Kineococcus terrestris]|uniref:hypothetical protein n=1 Tax=Kineococcus terrestris TaxID=2044856 RepID=UPI0034DB4FFD